MHPEGVKNAGRFETQGFRWKVQNTIFDRGERFKTQARFKTNMRG